MHTRLIGGRSPVHRLLLSFEHGDGCHPEVLAQVQSDSEAPTIRADTIRVFANLGLPNPPSLPTNYWTLKRSTSAEWRTTIATAAYVHASRHRPLTLVLYVITTLYLEAAHEDKLREVGMLEERRVDPQITVGLLVDAGGFPLETHAFEGNKGETTTLVPGLDVFRDRHKVTDVVVVADAGILSAANPLALEEAGLSFILGSQLSRPVAGSCAR